MTNPMSAEALAARIAALQQKLINGAPGELRRRDRRNPAPARATETERNGQCNAERTQEMYQETAGKGDRSR